MIGAKAYFYEYILAFNMRFEKKNIVYFFCYNFLTPNQNIKQDIYIVSANDSAGMNKFKQKEKDIYTK